MKLTSLTQHMAIVSPVLLKHTPNIFARPPSHVPMVGPLHCACPFFTLSLALVIFDISSAAPFSQSNTATLWQSSAAVATRYLPSLLNARWLIPLVSGSLIRTRALFSSVSHIEIKGYGPISPVATIFLLGCMASAVISSKCSLKNLWWCSSLLYTIPTAAVWYTNSPSEV